MGVPVVVCWPGITEQQLDEQSALSSDHTWGNWMAEREGEPNSHLAPLILTGQADLERGQPDHCARCALLRPAVGTRLPVLLLSGSALPARRRRRTGLVRRRVVASPASSQVLYSAVLESRP